MLCSETSPSSSVNGLISLVVDFIDVNSAHLILYGTFPIPSNGVISTPALLDAGAEAGESTADGSEVSIACTSTYFERCLDDDFQAPAKS